MSITSTDGVLSEVFNVSINAFLPFSSILESSKLYDTKDTKILLSLLHNTISKTLVSNSFASLSINSFCLSGIISAKFLSLYLNVIL